MRTSGSVPSYRHGVPMPGSCQLAVYAAVAWSSSCVVTVPSVVVTRAPLAERLVELLDRAVAAPLSSV